MNCQKSVVHFSLLWQFPQWLCNCLHIAGATVQYANGFEAKSSQKPPDLENQFLHR
jgi:hypothetical protein